MTVHPTLDEVLEQSFNTVPQIAYEASTRSYAAYAQLNFDITAQLELILGGRFTPFADIIPL